MAVYLNQSLGSGVVYLSEPFLESAIDNVPPVISGPLAPSVSENSMFSAVYTISDLDDKTPTLSGDDAHLFTIVSAGGDDWFLSMAPKNFEAPADNDGNNQYQVTLTADDLFNDPVSLAITVTVTNIDEGFWQFAPASNRIVSFS